VGGSRIGEPRGPKSGGLRPSGPIGVYAVVFVEFVQMALIHLYSLKKSSIEENKQ